MSRRQVWKRIAWYVGIAIVSLVLMLTIGYMTPRQWWIAPQTDCAVEIGVNSNGFHTNLIVPVQTNQVDWRSRLTLADIGDGSIQDYQYLSIGWGDRDFYLQTPTIQDLKISTVVRAMAFSAGSVLHVQGYPTRPQRLPGFTIKILRLSPPNYRALVQFIDQSFQRDYQGHPIIVKRGYRPNSSFYAANGHYSLIRTCNTWTADGLRAAQVNTPLWSGLAPAVMLHLRNGCPVETP
ncbi:MAG: TIGR02117 family protein [Cyanobacteria bacterium]|nr:TIGR02117 family protein [Cyanobacteriota bacterium]MDW8201274.1 TIGR02117 family protein [Cyanobacteriota bacterium SKYGB_h_bin112]